MTVFWGDARGFFQVLFAGGNTQIDGVRSDGRCHGFALVGSDREICPAWISRAVTSPITWLAAAGADCVCAQAPPKSAVRMATAVAPRDFIPLIAIIDGQR